MLLPYALPPSEHMHACRAGTSCILSWAGSATIHLDQTINKFGGSHACSPAGELGDRDALPQLSLCLGNPALEQNAENAMWKVGERCNQLLHCCSL